MKNPIGMGPAAYASWRGKITKSFNNRHHRLISQQEDNIVGKL